MSEISFRAQKALRGMDFVKDGITDLGVVKGSRDLNPTQAPTLDKITPKTRAQREQVPAEMAARLMDYYMNTLNDDDKLNPIRDGIPQCRNHPFNSPRQIGCIHSCAKRDPNVVLPVVRDYTLGDVYAWVKALVYKSVRDQETRMGYRRPTDLTR